MHGCSSASVLLVNAEADPMGGVVEGGAGIANKTSPRRAAIEKVQAELRQEYDVREERKRELEFLEKGGDPLDFNFGNAASVSVQSTSCTDQHPDPFVISEPKGSIGFTTSPHGDSVESSGRPGVPPCEANSADNLLLFDAEHELSEGCRTSLHPSASNNVPSEQSFQMDVSNKVCQHGNSDSLSLPRKAYERRYRSRPSREGIRSGSTDVNPPRGSHISSLPSHHGLSDAKKSVPDIEIQNLSLNCNLTPASPLRGGVDKTEVGKGRQHTELDAVKAVKSAKGPTKGGSPNDASDAIASDNPPDEQLYQQSLPGEVKLPIQMDSNGPEAIHVTREMNSAAIECQPSLSAANAENQSSSCQMNGFSNKMGDDMTNDAPSSALHETGLDAEASGGKSSQRIDGNKDSEMSTNMGGINSNGGFKDQALAPDGKQQVLDGVDLLKEKEETDVIDNNIHVPEVGASACQSQVENGLNINLDEESNESRSAIRKQVNNHSAIEGIECSGPTRANAERKTSNSLSDNPGHQHETPCNVRHQDLLDTSMSKPPDAGLLTKVPSVSLERETSVSDTKFSTKIDEDSILEEAQVIEAKRRRIAQLSLATSPKKVYQKSHWDYVLEEMAWLANDFAQERIWKINAASQICKRVAFTCRVRKKGKSLVMGVNEVARTLAEAVMEFWNSVEKRSKAFEHSCEKDGRLPVQAYAVRFLKNNYARVPSRLDTVSCSEDLDRSWENNLAEENLFYTIPPGAMEDYRKSIESHVAQCERMGSNALEEVETSTGDGVADFESPYNVHVGPKKRKHLTPAFGPRSYEIGSDLLPFQSTENKVLAQQSSLLTNRPGSSVNVLIPTKRMRTASRRVISPFNVGTSGCIQLPNKTDASSGETSSFQDEQSTLHYGSFIPNHLEVESVGNTELQLPFDSAEVSTKPKKKKAKHPNVAYEQRWQVDSSFHLEQFQSDHLKKRSESHQLESNGSSGLLGHPIIKKPKIMQQSQDNSFDNLAPVGGSAPSPVASQMSNMSNPAKLMKMLGGRDRGRKSKALKMPAGQLGSGIPWSHFEEQALVVLTHDLGPNWELVSDALNSALHFKCIFRNAKECKEHHNMLMDRTSGDGADSAEDSGSSQPYPSSLPGIPKGSARQLFQRLQGPIVEDTLKSHFEKIIMIAQKQHSRKNQDPKQLQSPHASHTIALSQVCPNNLNVPNQPVLTPGDLCDANVGSPDMLSLGYLGPHSTGLTIHNQGAGTPAIPASGTIAAPQGSPNVMLGSNFSSSPGHLNALARDCRYLVPRSASLPADEHQRMQQYTHMMISGRNTPHSNISSAGALQGTDRGVRILPGGNGIGMVSGINRSISMARPGPQGIASSSMISPGSMVSPGQGSSMLRPREAFHMMRDSQRQMMVPDLQMPGNGQGVSLLGGLSSPFPNQTPPVSSYPIQHQSHAMPPQQSQVLNPQHPHFQGPGNHGPAMPQQAYAIRLAKERQLQHRFLQQQQQQPQQQQKQQFASSNSLMPHVQSQPQLPVSSPMQTSSQVSSQAGSPSTPVSSINSIPQQKHPKPTQGGVRNAQTGGNGLTNQTGKQRQRQQQQFSQANRQHPQQRQQIQAQQQAKVPKGVDKGNIMMPHKIPNDPSVLNAVSANRGNNQCLGKGEPSANVMQSQGTYTGSALHTSQPTRLYVSTSQLSNQTPPQQKMYSGQASTSSKHLQHKSSQSDNSSQGHVSLAAPSLSAGHQSVPSMAMPGSNHQRSPSNQKLVNQKQQALQEVVQPNCQINSDPSNKSGVRDSDSDQHLASSSIEMDIGATLAQAHDPTNVAQVVSPASAHEWNASEPLLESNFSSMVPTHSNSGESVPQAGQRLSQRSSPATLTHIRHDVNSQWPQQASQALQPDSPLPQPEQQPLQPPQQSVSKLHSPQQAQLLQAGNGNSLGSPGDHRLE